MCWDKTVNANYPLPLVVAEWQNLKLFLAIVTKILNVLRVVNLVTPIFLIAKS